MTRTEGDTWDLASSVGATATAVAASRALATRQPDPLINDPYADPLVKAVGLDHCNRVADGTLHRSTTIRCSTKQRMCEQIAVRTRFFDDFFTDATAAGIRQAVILASGLDTRAYRLRWPAGTVVFEIDQPAGDRVQDPDARRPRRRADRRPAHRRHRPARRLAGSIARQRFRPERSRRRGSPRAC